MSDLEVKREAAVKAQKEALRNLIKDFYVHAEKAKNPMELEEMIGDVVGSIQFLISANTNTALIAALNVIRKDVLETIDKGMTKNIEVIAKGIQLPGRAKKNG